MGRSRAAARARPGDTVASESWPSFAAGTRGVLNTMAPQHHDVSALADVSAKPPILWIHGEKDAIVADGSFFDLNTLGQAGIVPGWPGAEVAPPQPMKVQTRAFLERYSANGGVVREVALPDAGHAPHLDEADVFVRELVAHVTSAG